MDINRVPGLRDVLGEEDFKAFMATIPVSKKTKNQREKLRLQHNEAQNLRLNAYKTALTSLAIRQSAESESFPDTAPWYTRAACRGMDPGVFVIEQSLGGVLVKKIQAIGAAVCKHCPVRSDCLKDAIEYADRNGIRGGYTPDELKPLMVGRARRVKQ